MQEFDFSLSGGRIFNQLIPLVPPPTRLAVQTVEKVQERETLLHPVPRLKLQAKVELLFSCWEVDFDVSAGAEPSNPFGDDDDEYDSSGKNPFAD